MRMILKRLPSTFFLLAMSAGVARAQSASPASDEWQFFVTPFLWGAGIDGTVGLAGRDRDFEVSAKDLMKSLDFGIMGNFEARRNRLSFGADLVYTDLGKDVGLENSSRTPRLDMSMTIIEGNVGYGAFESLDILAGLRGVISSVSLEEDSSTLAEVDGSFADPFVGARFRRDLTEKVWVNFRGDVGGFGVGSDFSWFVGATGGFRVSRSISLDLGYRVWNMDYENANELKRLDAVLAGFAFGLTFRF
ncbi:MAG: hypothetical protein ACRD3V_26110 [Vicinamibacteria bacterium]